MSKKEAVTFKSLYFCYYLEVHYMFDLCFVVN